MRNRSTSAFNLNLTPYLKEPSPKKLEAGLPKCCDRHHNHCRAPKPHRETDRDEKRVWKANEKKWKGTMTFVVRQLKSLISNILQSGNRLANYIVKEEHLYALTLYRNDQKALVDFLQREVAQKANGKINQGQQSNNNLNSHFHPVPDLSPRQDSTPKGNHFKVLKTKEISKKINPTPESSSKPHSNRQQLFSTFGLPQFNQTSIKFFQNEVRNLVNQNNPQQKDSLESKYLLKMFQNEQNKGKLLHLEMLIYNSTEMLEKGIEGSGQIQKFYLVKKKKIIDALAKMRQCLTILKDRKSKCWSNSQIQYLSFELANQKNELKLLGDQNNRLETEILKIQGKFQDSHNALKEEEQNYEAIKKQNVELNWQLGQFSNEIQKKDEVIEYLKIENNQLKETIRGLEDLNMQNNQRENKIHDFVYELELKISELESELNLKERHAIDYQKLLKAYAEEIETISGLLAEAQTKFKQRDLKIQQLSSKCEINELQNESLRESISQLQKQKQENSISFYAKLSQIYKLEEENSSLKQRCNQIAKQSQNELQSIKIQQQSLQQINQQLKSLIAEYQQAISAIISKLQSAITPQAMNIDTSAPKMLQLQSLISQLLVQERESSKIRNEENVESKDQKVQKITLKQFQNYEQQLQTLRTDMDHLKAALIMKQNYYTYVMSEQEKQMNDLKKEIQQLSILHPELNLDPKDKHEIFLKPQLKSVNALSESNITQNCSIYQINVIDEEANVIETQENKAKRIKLPEKADTHLYEKNINRQKSTEERQLRNRKSLNSDSDHLSVKGPKTTLNSNLASLALSDQEDKLAIQSLHEDQSPKSLTSNRQLPSKVKSSLKNRSLSANQ